MRLLLDSDFLVALIKKDDANHSLALDLAERNKQNVFFVSQFVPSEVATVLSHKVSQNSAKKFLTEFRKMNIIELPFDSLLRDLTDQIFISSGVKRTSWVDCLNVASIKYFNLDGIISFDKFYKKYQIKVIK